jgi:hypothetical protein
MSGISVRERRGGFGHKDTGRNRVTMEAEISHETPSQGMSRVTSNHQKL